MPYIIIRGNLASYSHKYPWRVLVSGLKADDIEQLNKFSCGGYCDESTIVYRVHPCRILSALEILGFRVVASSSTSVKQDYNEYMWTMRKEFDEPEPESESVSVVRENLSNIGREAASLDVNMDLHSADNCKCHKQTQPAQQTLSDMDFDRGIWNAAIYNEVERVREFIKKGQAMARDDCDYTALHYAARNGNEQICKLLLDEGKVDVNAVTKAGATALHRAAMMGHLNIVKLLADQPKANLLLQDECGQSALHRAALRDQLDVCRYLLQREPSLKLLKDKKDKIPFEYIMENANDDFKLLLKP